MRCRSCDYPLWNISARECPECGSSFKPSEYRFVINAVEFGCPHCKQTYFGTTAEGRLDPESFDCAKCGERIHMDEMILNPLEGADDSEVMQCDIPLFDTEGRSKRSRFWSTFGHCIAKPGAICKGLRGQTDGHAASLYATWIIFLVALVITAVNLGFVLLLSGLGGGIAATDLFGALVAAIVLFFAALIYLAIWMFVAHGIIMMGGEPRRKLGATGTGIALASSPMLFLAIPCIPHLTFLAAIPAFIWWMILAVIFTARAHGISGMRASLAVLPFPILSVGTAIGLVVFAIFSTIAMVNTMMAGPMGAPIQPGSSYEIQAVGWAITSSAANNTGVNNRRHVLGLVESGVLFGDEFILPDSMTYLSDIPLADKTLDDLIMIDWSEEDAVYSAIDDLLPEEPAIYRVGDLVMVHEGFDPMTSDANLWLVIAAYDPDTNPNRSTTPIEVYSVAGFGQSFTREEFETELAIQNELRKQLNLPTVPHPDDVRHITAN